MSREPSRTDCSRASMARALGVASRLRCNRFLGFGVLVDRRPLHVTFRRVSSTRDRVRQHRERLRRQGLRPVQIWVPDVRAPEFIAEAHRQSIAIAG